ncbi:DUF488 domain-containing protein [Chryseobacterium gwangjuense]|uniref:DUF488 domain-containing protein n=1 Tax=Chryseobacterium gwangjuense TaxID=1069980 RepID=UPI001E65C3CA|nr:DUF488 family protein [Chryseobacterium gwangjuense]MCE3074683.1 DUF488 family protein [Chryseobacterium gwangjuense]
MSIITLKRIYEQPSAGDGCRILVDRLWPRAISKEKADIAEWNKDLAPLTELRLWFHHDPNRWDEFSVKYMQELRSSNLGETFLQQHINQEKITLVYAAKDEKHCHPIVLKRYLESLM